MLMFLFFVYSYIDKNKSRFIDNLKNAVSIQSVSGDPNRRNEVVKMIYWVANRLTALNATVEICDIGMQVSYFCDFCNERSS